MSVTNEKKYSHERPEKDPVLAELCFVLRVYLIWENKKRDHETGLEGLSGEGDETGDMDYADMTDKEMRAFRYVY